MTIILDRNRIQIDGSTDEIAPGLEPLAQKIHAFGWETISAR
jgi:transketolase N-terminal domain/subunit